MCFALYPLLRRELCILVCSLLINRRAELVLCRRKNGHFCVASETVELLQSNQAVRFVQFDAKSLCHFRQRLFSLGGERQGFAQKDELSL
jgi:hypothetical protein